MHLLFWNTYLFCYPVYQSILEPPHYHSINSQLHRRLALASSIAQYKVRQQDHRRPWTWLLDLVLSVLWNPSLQNFSPILSVKGMWIIALYQTYSFQVLPADYSEYRYKIGEFLPVCSLLLVSIELRLRPRIRRCFSLVLIRMLYLYLFRLIRLLLKVFLLFLIASFFNFDGGLKYILKN